MRKKPGIAVTRMLGLSVSLLGLLLALALPTAPSAHAEVGCGAAEIEQLQHEGRTLIQEEQLRSENHSTGLPDCRAYEQVTPTFKNGFGAVLLYVLAGGERALVESLGVFSGAVPSEDCAVHNYGIARTSAGWVTSALDDAPLTQFDTAERNCAAEVANDEGASLSLLRPVAGSVYARDLYVHEPDGQFVLVGPVLPPTAVPPTPTGPGEAGGFQPEGGFFVEATHNFSHVLFTLEAQSKSLAPGVKTELWPGDTTALSPEAFVYTPSLYEYVGTNNTTPTLVGVDNNGHLISDCGTAPGGWASNGSGNHLNVISEDGSRVFFTAVGHNPECAAEVAPPVPELYARLNSGQPQSPVDAQGHCTVAADACTVAISEPGAGPDCTEACVANATNEADFRDANYAKASRDGSKVFFTSTQQLLNGATQDSNNLYEYDLEENPETGAPIGLSLVSGGDSSGRGPQVQGVAAVSEDGSHVYFVAKGVLTKTPNEYGASAIEEENNLYVNNTTTGQTAFIATLAESDNQQWTNNAMDATDDGEFLVFTSINRLVPGDTSTVPQVFRYDAASGALDRVSLGDEGKDGLGASHISVRENTHEQALETPDSDSHPAISEDGSTVVFNTSEALVSEAPTNNRCEKEEAYKGKVECTAYVQNVYEYREGHIYLIAGNASEGPIVSPSGRDIFFETSESLGARDGDTVNDIYDARSDGGFPAAAAAGPCGGEACQGPVSTAPVFGAPASASLTGSGDLAGGRESNPAPAAKPKAKPKKKVSLTCKLRKASRTSEKTSRTCKSKARKVHNKRGARS